MIRSNFSSSGWIMPNSEGIIDKGYTGTLKIPLLKVSPTAVDISQLMSGSFQLIMEPIPHTMVEQVLPDQIIPTSRGSGGFGSTITK
jgi:dUTP pyrophosphatase